MNTAFKFFTLDKIAGYRSIIGAWLQMISGILLAVAALVSVANDCVQGTIDLQSCAQKIPAAAIGVGIAAQGLSNLGIRFQK